MINAGICGDGSVHGLERLDRDVLSYSPSLAVICFGLNDVHQGMTGIGHYTSTLQGIFKKLKENDTEAIFLTPNMMNTYVSGFLKEAILIDVARGTAELQNDGTMDTYMEAACDICNDAAIPVCDCYKVWKSLHKAGADVTSLLSNYINHPAREMHSIFSSSLFNTIINS